MAATPAELRALIKQVQGAMKEMDSLRGKAEIPTWEKKELKEQRALARGKIEWAKKQLASQAKSPDQAKAQAEKKASTAKKAATPAKSKTTSPKTTPKVRGGGGIKGPISLGGGGGLGKIK
jgi:septal ring factor EnvC (AmiA/AmiB activator)